MTDIYMVDVTEFEDDEIFDKLSCGLTNDRVEKIRRMKSKKDRKLSLGAGLLLKYALAVRGIDAINCEYEFGPHGKPYVVSKNNLYYNLSHSGHYAVCAVSENEVGIDIERVKEANERIAERFFTLAERKYLLTMPKGRRRNDAFCRIWTLKESYVKAIGMGLSIPLRSFEVVPSENIKLEREGKTFFFREYHTEGYKISVCSESDAFVHRIEIVTPALLIMS